MSDDELRVVELLSRGGLNAKQVIIGNSGTINYNDYGDREQAQKHEAKEEEQRGERWPQPLSDERRQLLQQIMDLIAQGEWHLSGGGERVCAMMCRVLGADGVALTQEERQMSEQLWTLFEHRRGGEALRVTFLNMIGYWDERGLFHHHGGSPALCKMFFKTDDGYCNIDKGRPGRSGMLKDFEGVLPLLDQYCPQNE